MYKYCLAAVAAAFFLCPTKPATAGPLYTGIEYSETGTPQVTRFTDHAAIITSDTHPNVAFTITNPIFSWDWNRITFKAIDTTGPSYSSDFWEAWIQLPSSQSFEVGHYDVATTTTHNRYNTNFSTCISYFGYGSVQGSFDILEIRHDAAGKVSNFAADLTIQSFGDTVMNTAVRYNSKFAFPSSNPAIPEPAAFSLFALGLIPLLRRPRHH